MSQSLLGIEIDNGDVLLKFVQTAAETEGQLHAQEARYVPRSRPPPYHRHPKQDERFVIVEGSLLFHINGADRLVKAGEEIAIPRGSFHRAHNPGDIPTLALWESRPALRTGEFFVAMNRATRGHAKPPLTDALAVLSEFREEFQLAKPPPFVQRVLFSCLAPFGKPPSWERT